MPGAESPRAAGGRSEVAGRAPPHTAPARLRAPRPPARSASRPRAFPQPRRRPRARPRRPAPRARARRILAAAATPSRGPPDAGGTPALCGGPPGLSGPGPRPLSQTGRARPDRVTTQAANPTGRGAASAAELYLQWCGSSSPGAGLRGSSVLRLLAISGCAVHVVASQSTVPQTDLNLAS